MSECVACAALAGRPIVVPPGGDCRDTACELHRRTLRWVELQKPARAPGAESCVLPEILLERVE